MGITDSYQANTTYTRIGNANVIDIRPKDWIDNHKVLVYTHGGGYTQLSANSTLGGALTVANFYRSENHFYRLYASAFR